MAKLCASDLENFLKRPIVNKFFSFLAITPHLIYIFVIYRQGRDFTNFPTVVLCISLLAQNLPFLFRKPAQRISMNPFYWLLAFFGAYWVLIWTFFDKGGPSLLTRDQAYLLLCIALFLTVYSRFSLGIKISYVPSDRGVEVGGAYRFVRHPIYAGLFVNLIVIVLCKFSWINALSYAFMAAIFVIKTFQEEKFMSGSPEYREYMKRVKYRYLPGVF